jgi:hypothetical protein
MSVDAETFLKNIEKSGEELMKLSRNTVPAGTLEQSFEQSFIAQGHSPEKAAALAKTAAAGPDFEKRF